MKIQVAGVSFEVEPLYPTTEKYCEAFLTNEPAEHNIVLTPEDIAFERQKNIREAEVEGIPYVDFPDAYLETIALQRKIAELFFDYDRLLFHGSAIAVDGKAYLFTAKSGTGKSTHTRLWRELLGERAVMVNDDKPFLSFESGGVIVHGSPWNGKHRLGSNLSVPLSAICILERGEENRIRELAPSQALSMLIQQSSRPRDAAKLAKYMELLDKLARGVKFYRLSCNMSLDAARVSYTEMSKENRKQEMIP